MVVRKNKIKFLSLLVGILLLTFIISGCNSTNNSETQTNVNTGKTVKDLETKSTTTTEKTVNIDKLEILHFHATNQCVSCITVGDYAEETVKTYFQKELDEGLIVFGHINGELPINSELVVKYGATGSSLWLGTYKGDDFKAEQNIQVWYKTRNKQDYMDYLKGEIEQKLAGN